MARILIVSLLPGPIIWESHHESLMALWWGGRALCLQIFENKTRNIISVREIRKSGWGRLACLQVSFLPSRCVAPHSRLCLVMVDSAGAHALLAQSTLHSKPALATQEWEDVRLCRLVQSQSFGNWVQPRGLSSGYPCAWLVVA